MTTIQQLYDIYRQHPVICTDTRKITPGCLFFALRGDKFNANAFAAQAIEAGAAYAVIDEAAYQLNPQFLLVNDVLTALQNLARHHRSQLAIPVIGLTGSNGKTTTKELISAVLSQGFNTYATAGNLNNHIGVPLTLLAIGAQAQIAVVEMGANHQKEIELLSSIAQPGYGLITNIGKAHLEGFGGTQGVIKGKGELFDFLKQTNGVAFVNANSPVLLQMVADRQLPNVVYYGAQGQAVTGALVQNATYLKLQWQQAAQPGVVHTVQSQLTGAYNLDNILAAISIGLYFNLSAEQINAGIANYAPQNNRSQIVQTANNTLVCDYYNANPSSMLVALDNLQKLPPANKVIILGDMFELGDEAVAEHQAIIEKAMLADAVKRVFIGEHFYNQRQGIAADFYATAPEAIAALSANPIKNATVLIKGSRGMALERLVQYL